MTAHILPAIAAHEKPIRKDANFPNVRKSALDAIPGHKGLPILGVLPEAVRDPFVFTRKMYEHYGAVHRFYACGNWNVQLVGPEANEFVLFDREGNFSAYGGWKPVFGRHFDGGLLLRDGQDHLWHRKLIATAFKQDQLQAYLGAFSSNIARFCADWSGRTLDAYELSQQLTFANGYTAFLGRDAAQATRDDLLAFRYMMRSATAVLPWAVPGSAHGRASWAKRHIERLLSPMLAEVPREGRTDLASVLIRMRQEGLLTESEVVAHLTFTIAASFDALSSGTVSTLYYLARNPDWQRRVRDELCCTISSPADINLAELQSCHESEWAVKESLRLNAAAPVLWRRALRDFQFQGYSIPAGTVTGVNPMLTHLLPEIWDQPKRFDPARFAPEESRLRHRFAYVPFGAGAHGCLGANFASLQARALLRSILEDHELVLAEDREPRWYHWPNCRPLGGLTIELRRLATRAPRKSKSRF
jgi:cytochrome P450